MWGADWDNPKRLTKKGPNTFLALQRLVMVMGEMHGIEHGASILAQMTTTRHGTEAVAAFDQKFRDTIEAMLADKIVKRDADPDDVRKALCKVIVGFSKIFPNWQDAYSFSAQYLVADSGVANEKIRTLMT